VGVTQRYRRSHLAWRKYAVFQVAEIAAYMISLSSVWQATPGPVSCRCMTWSSLNGFEEACRCRARRERLETN
jgi:hypothetical protein